MLSEDCIYIVVISKINQSDKLSYKTTGVTLKCKIKAKELYKYDNNLGKVVIYFTSHQNKLFIFLGAKLVPQVLLLKEYIKINSITLLIGFWLIKSIFDIIIIFLVVDESFLREKML